MHYALELQHSQYGIFGANTDIREFLKSYNIDKFTNICKLDHRQHSDPSSDVIKTLQYLDLLITTFTVLNYITT